MINSRSDESLDYDKHPNGLNVIAVGGNKLSRGLTLDGLTVSFYMRKTRMYIPNANGKVVWLQDWL